VAPQTEEVYKRKHAYRTEVFQIQDYFIKEKRHVNQALVGHAAVAIMQSTAARVGMFTKTRHDGKTVRWRKENPLRVRDIVHKVRKLVLKAKQGDSGDEATSHMQINWRRVKKLQVHVSSTRTPMCSECGCDRCRRWVYPL